MGRSLFLEGSYTISQDKGVQVCILIIPNWSLTLTEILKRHYSF